MIPKNNNIKSSAAILIFCLSAAAWVTSELMEENQPAAGSVAQAENPNHDMVLRPLTD
jgi:hypothetical protein